MCLQSISLKDPSSQELLNVVEHERKLQTNRPRNTSIFHHPILGDFELQHLPYTASNSELEERIIQHVAASAAMGRAHHLEVRSSRSAAQGHPHFWCFRLIVMDLLQCWLLLLPMREIIPVHPLLQGYMPQVLHYLLLEMTLHCSLHINRLIKDQLLVQINMDVLVLNLNESLTLERIISLVVHRKVVSSNRRSPTPDFAE